MRMPLSPAPWQTPEYVEAEYDPADDTLPLRPLTPTQREAFADTPLGRDLARAVEVAAAAREGAG